jgi:hypothetical protein
MCSKGHSTSSESGLGERSREWGYQGGSTNGGTILVSEVGCSQSLPLFSLPTSGRTIQVASEAPGKKSVTRVHLGSGWGPGPTTEVRGSIPPWLWRFCCAWLPRAHRPAGTRNLGIRRIMVEPPAIYIQHLWQRRSAALPHTGPFHPHLCSRLGDLSSLRIKKLRSLLWRPMGRWVE